jgi:DNA-binding PucR family transcriptional regulator
MLTLRATLRAFFATRMRVAPTAELLFLHRNTLISRLDRVERLLGHRVSERTAEVQAALLLSELPEDPRQGARTE